MEFITGAMAGAFACCFVNPLDLVKTRLQLQGELKARGQHSVHYKNTIHAIYVIGKTEGLRALQKGLVPALWFQVTLNGTRLGTIGTVQNWGWTKNKNNHVSLFKTALLSSITGCCGSFLGSPFYLIKVHHQSQAATEIAVGYQHPYTKTLPGLIYIYNNEGTKGLWRGTLSSFPRIGIGSAAQMSTFFLAKEFFEENEVFTSEPSLWNTFWASMLSGFVAACFMTPFDVVQTRLYNQGVDSNGKGLLYSGIFDCFVKMWHIEGFQGFFKGFGPCYLRIGPHSLLTLVFWDFFKKCCI